MSAFTFQARFVMPIVTGKKISTIRRERRDGCKPCKRGQTIKLYYYDLNTTQNHLIGEAVCADVERIEISCPTGCIYTADIISPDGHEGYRETHLDVVMMEGFDSGIDMMQWFDKHYRISEKPFRGWRIIWKDFR